jgi:carboxylesterase type B
MYSFVCGTLFALSALFPLASAQSNATDAPTVNLGYVSYRGYQNVTAGITYYRGIPYAQPPVGALRWRKPRAIEAQNNFAGKTVDATQIGPACYQSLPLSLYSPGNVSNESFIATPQGQSEDCLILDVLVPSNPASESLPVLVQLHGGGYTEGNAQSYPGDALVHASNGGLIYVYVAVFSVNCHSNAN